MDSRRPLLWRDREELSCITRMSLWCADPIRNGFTYLGQIQSCILSSLVSAVRHYIEVAQHCSEHHMRWEIPFCVNTNTSTTDSTRPLSIRTCRSLSQVIPKLGYCLVIGAVKALHI